MSTPIANDSAAKPTEQLAALDETTAPRAGYILYVSAGAREDLAKSVPLGERPVVAGAHPDSDLCLTDSSVSRHHLRATAVGGDVLVEDLGSTNGTTYLGQRIERGRLKPGARLQLGRCSVDILPASPDSLGLKVSEQSSYGDLVGESTAMRRLYTVLEMLENTDAPVLVEGETGTGKEMVARAIHAHSQRASGPFLVIDCANVAAGVIESELFGHVRGAFTGAARDHEGAFELASGGTVFLDELDELALDLQGKLLRVLERREVRKVGGEQYKPVDVRVVAASKRALGDEVARGRFRQDLFYRVAVVQVRLPPLRERREDIPLLAAHLARQLGGDAERLDASVETFLLGHDWPGNVRELRNVLQRVLALGPAALSMATPPAFAGAAARERRVCTGLTLREAREQALGTFERDYLESLWQDTGKNLSETARRADIDRKTLRALLQKYGIH